jgi:ribose-phosphate pyrophosphokinase
VSSLGADARTASQAAPGPSGELLMLFVLPGFDRLAPGARDDMRVQRFPNGELHITLGCDVADRRCALIGSVAPPDDQLVTFTLAADTLRRHGARAVTAVLPYLGYARQDRLEPSRSLAAGWIGELLRGSGVTDVITVDIHSEEAARLLAVPVRSLSPAPLFADALGQLSNEDTVMVAPDAGARTRAAALAGAAEIPTAVAWLQKRRTPGGVSHSRLVGELSPHAVVVDDMLDTGGTLVSCCRILLEHGVQRISIAVTHGLFSDIAWRELLRLRVEAIHTTDSVARALFQLAPGIRVHPIQDLLTEALE